jgi:hypothetical protein
VGVLAQVFLDARPFLLILLVIILAFGTAFNALGQFSDLDLSLCESSAHAAPAAPLPAHPTAPQPLCPELDVRACVCVRVHSDNTFFIGVGAEDFLDGFTALGVWAKIMQIGCVLLIVVVLMNLLVAIVCDSFARMCEVEPLWFQLERAKIIRDNNKILDTLGNVLWCLKDDTRAQWLHVLRVKDIAADADEDEDGTTDAWDPEFQQKRASARTATELEKLGRELQSTTKALEELRLKVDRRN